MPIHELILERPHVEKVYFNLNDNPVYVTEHYDEDNNCYYYLDEYGYDSYFKVSLVTNRQYCGKNDIKESRLELSYCCGDRSLILIEKHEYQQLHCDYWIKINF